MLSVSRGAEERAPCSRWGNFFIGRGRIPITPALRTSHYEHQLRWWLPGFFPLVPSLSPGSTLIQAEQFTDRDNSVYGQAPHCMFEVNAWKEIVWGRILYLLVGTTEDVSKVHLGKCPRSTGWKH